MMPAVHNSPSATYGQRVVDALPGGVGIGMFEDVQRVRALLDRHLEPLVGDLVTDEHSDSVRVFGPKERDLNARALAPREHDSRKPGAREMIRVAHRFPPRWSGLVSCRASVKPAATGRIVQWLAVVVVRPPCVMAVTGDGQG